MSDFDLRKAIRTVLDETDLSSPEEVAQKVAESIPANRRLAVLAMALRDTVRIEMSRIRNDPPPSLKGNASAKVRAIREAAPKWLRDRVYVGTGWTLFGDCSYEEVLYLRTERLENAARSHAKGEHYGRVAAEMKRCRVTRVADLPRRVLDTLEANDPELAA